MDAVIRQITGKVMTRANSYPLGYSDDEALRLARQAALLQDLTEDVFRRAGIVSGMQVLDLGSGVGDVSFLAARMVGPSGSVLGIERNASSVKAASQRAEKLGVRNVRFEAVDLESFGGRGAEHGKQAANDLSGRWTAAPHYDRRDACREWSGLRGL